MKKLFIPKNKKSALEIIVVLAFSFLFNLAVYNITKLITMSRHHFDMTLEIDSHFPFIPWTVIIYFSWFVFWLGNYYLLANGERAERNRLFAADILGRIVCFVIFIALPTTNIRPEIEDGGVWNFFMKFLYLVDTPQNLFPSIHCYASWLCFIGVRRRKDMRPWYKILTLLWAVAICISTLTTRQHVTVDVISGIALAEITYLIAAIPKVQDIYQRIIDFFLRLFKIDRIKENE